MKILLAVDGSRYTKHMLAYIAAHDDLLGPGHAYTVFFAVLPIPSHAADYFDKPALDAHYREQSDQVLGPVRAFAAQQGWKAEFVSTPGHAPDLIAAYADAHKFDLLVMGSHGHTALVNVVLGSVTTRVLALCKTPMLLVR